MALFCAYCYSFSSMYLPYEIAGYFVFIHVPNIWSVIEADKLEPEVK